MKTWTNTVVALPAAPSLRAALEQAIPEYERVISIPAVRAGLNETDWIVRRAFDAAYDQAATDTNNEAEAA